MYTIAYLKQHSHLPGPRGNLELLYAFAKEAPESAIKDCLGYIKTDTQNSPEEFVGMCGILGYAISNKEDMKSVLAFIRPFASHKSWRIREAVAMAIQEISENRMPEALKSIKAMQEGNDYEKRAVVAGLCEPKLLKEEKNAIQVLLVLSKITDALNHDRKLSDGETSLRKALAYGWSVAIVHAPEQGKKTLEQLAAKRGKHIQWIIKENLKKNRLVKMDERWVNEMRIRLNR